MVDNILLLTGIQDFTICNENTSYEKKEGKRKIFGKCKNKDNWSSVQFNRVNSYQCVIRIAKFGTNL